MKETANILLLILAVALVGALIFGLWLIGREAVMVLAGLFVGGLVLIGIIAAAALPIRAWRKNDAAPIEKQVIREVRILDNRPAQAPQLPAPQQAPFGVFPELLRASYQAGQLAAPRGEIVEGEAKRLDGADWTGDIMA
jgi:hypothetical protein